MAKEAEMSWEASFRYLETLADIVENLMNHDMHSTLTSHISILRSFDGCLPFFKTLAR